MQSSFVVSRIKVRWARWISMILAAVMMLGMLPAGILAAEGGPASIRYSFLDAFTADGSLVALGDLTKSPITTRQTAYGAAISATAVDQSRSFQYTVPSSGTYSFAFQGYLYFSAGIGQLSVDGTPIGTYDFYNATGQFGPMAEMGNLNLAAGTHTLTFKVTGRNPSASSGTNYSMYPSAFTLTPAEAPAFVALAAIPSRSLLLIGETSQISVTAGMSDGSPLGSAAITYNSSNETVATVGASGLITGIGKGNTVITTTVTSDQGTASRTSTVTVSDGLPTINPVLYNFLDAFSGNGSLVALGTLTDPPKTSKNNAYGAAISATAIGQVRSFRFVVPASGYYLVTFQGYLYFSSGIGEISVDGSPIGTYDFYDPGSRFGPTASLKTMALAEGSHTITFKVVGRNPRATSGSNYSMYATKLGLTPMPGPAQLQFSASPSKSLLMLNETAQMSTTYSMSDGTAITQPSVQFTSDNETVATVSTSGLMMGVGKGTAVITATLSSDQGTVSKNAALTVTDQQLTGVEVTLEPEELYVGGSAKVMLNGILTDGTSADLSHASAIYAVDDPEIASVTQNGIVTGKQIGQTVIRVSVTFNGKTVDGSYTVAVTPKTLATVELVLEQASITVSQYAGVAVKGKFEDGSDADLALADIEFASVSPNKAEVDPASGEYHGIQAGTAELSARVTLGGVTGTGTAVVTVRELTSDKTRSTYFTPEKVANARANVQQYGWAKGIRDAAVTAANPFVSLGFENLWNLVPPQTLPRSYGVNQVMGSPVTGHDIDRFGNYPYMADPIKEPWKITDPSSGYKFPTNDFGAYYRSGLDKHGVFQPALADRSLLVNTLYPEKGPTWGVDDGYGWVDDNGNRYTFISYYVHWQLWYSSGIIENAIKSLRDAYVYTGDMKYARAGIVLLDRIADVYPSLDASAYDPNIYLQSAQGTGTGKAVGSIWETTLVQDFLSAYDAFFPAMDDPEAIAFLSEKGRKYHLSWKDSGTGLRRNAEDGIVRQVYPGVKKSQIRGNVGMHQSSLALAAVVLDTMPEIKEWIDFNNQSGGLVTDPWRVTGGNLLTALVNTVDRDGQGDEAAPGYNRLWLSNYLQVADYLYGYDKYPTADLYQNVKFQSMFKAMYPLMLSENYVPTIGDTGSTGNPGLTGLDKAQMIKAFSVYGDPIYAQLAHFLNNNTTEGIHSDIFTANPERIAADIEAIIQSEGPLDLASSNLTGYGFTALRDGENDKRKYGVSYGFPQLAVTEATTAYNTYDASGTVQLEATTAGQRLSFAFDVVRSDSYTIRLKPFRAPSYGIYRVYIDNQFVKEIDFFGASKEYETVSELVMAAGTHTITFENNGKSSSANNYKMGVTELQLLTSDELAKVLSQQNTLRDIWTYYGRNSGHGHRDTLNLGIHAYGLDLAPDLGYPEFADNIDMHRAQWVNNTISHNTVVVNARKQGTQFVSTPKHYDDGEFVKLTDVEAKVYSQTEAYRRTTAMIRVDDENSYSVDFFRVKGGNDHHFSFHSAEGTVTTEGLALTAQSTGTYAGANVPFGERVDDVAGADYMGSGFQWLKNVERGTATGGQFSVDWNAKDTWNVLGAGAHANSNVHLRLTMLGPVSDVALADGVPPRNKPGNPSEIRYLIAHRTGQNLDSLFTSVIEPYKGQRYIADISPVAVKRDGTIVDTNVDNSVRAVKVTLTNGRIDYIIQSSDANAVYTIDDKIMFNGFFGVYSEENGQQTYAYVQDGGKIGAVGTQTLQSTGALTGTVTDFTKELSLSNSITVQMNLNEVSEQSLIGLWIYVANDGARNAVYPIRGVTSLGGDSYRLNIGDLTAVRGYVDANDFSKGFVYDMAAGAAFRIPLSAEVKLPVTVASVAGTQSNGWYTDTATVTLNVVSNNAEVLRTEFSLDDGATWTPYTGPIAMAESGKHNVQYRSINKQQVAEAVKTIEVPIDKLTPVTEAVLAGEKGNDPWYVSKVTVSLRANDAHSGVASTEYRIASDPQAGADFVTYTAPFTLGDGVHTVLFRSIDAAGNREKEHSIEVRIDSVKPTVSLVAGGSPLVNGAVLEDALPVTLELNAADLGSGVVRRTITVTDATYGGSSAYGDSAVVDWAGHFGAYMIQVEAADAAGNVQTETISVTVVTSLDSMSRLLDRYEASGDVNGPLVPQLRNALLQAQQHISKGSTEQAAKHLMDFLKHLENDPMRRNVSDAAFASLSADARYLIEQNS
jgi:uncharacterized protein YjdB